MSGVRTAARPMLAWIFISGGLDTLRKPGPRAEIAAPALGKLRAVAPFLPDEDVTLVRANAAVQLAAGTLLALGRLPRLSALALAGSLAPTTAAGHPFWTVEDPAKRAQQRIQFNKNLAVLGGLLLAAADRPRPRARGGG